MLTQKITGEGLELDYYTNFYTQSEADEIFKNLEKNIKYFEGDLARVKVFGKWHKIPRKQAAFGDEGLKYKFSGVTVPAMQWIECLRDVRCKIEELLGHRYNFVLVNRYQSGNDYMGEHRDDEPEIEEEPGIASISLGDERDFRFRHSDARAKLRQVAPITVKLKHGSLLHMKPPTNKFWYHSLPVRKKQAQVRINLTFRSIRLQKGH